MSLTYVVVRGFRTLCLERQREASDTGGLYADYSDVIREPVDLGTIRERLNQEGCGGYQTLADVTEDVQLVFKNAMTYNIEKSQIHEDAGESLKAFEADLAATLERVCTKGVEALQDKADQDAAGGKDKLEDAGKGDMLADSGLRPQYLPPQVVAGVLQSKLEEWDRRQNWSDSFDRAVPLPAGWTTVNDFKSAKVYYWNKSLAANQPNSTTWDQPKPPSVAMPWSMPLQPRPKAGDAPAVGSAHAQEVGMAVDDGVQQGAPVQVKTELQQVVDSAVAMQVDGVQQLAGNVPGGGGGEQESLQPSADAAAQQSVDVKVKLDGAPRAASAQQGRIPQAKHLPSPYLDRCDALTSAAPGPIALHPARYRAESPRRSLRADLGRYYCPIFCCWRPLNVSDNAGGVRYYGR
jgi:hypothetical protein